MFTDVSVMKYDKMNNMRSLATPFRMSKADDVRTFSIPLKNETKTKVILLRNIATQRRRIIRRRKRRRTSQRRRRMRAKGCMSKMRMRIMTMRRRRRKCREATRKQGEAQGETRQDEGHVCECW